MTYPGVNLLLMGPTGTGKTHALSTLADAGLEVFVLFLEPSVETLVGAFTDPPPRGRGKELPSNIHWRFLNSKTPSWKSLMEAADFAGKFDLSTLAKMKDTQRGENNPFLEVYSALNDFKDDRTGKSFGPVDSWGTDRVLVIDHLTALGKRAMDMMVGTKPMRDKPDYGIAQTNLMNLLDKLINGCRCHFVMLAHVEREVDEVLGGVKLMPSSIGKAIAPAIPVGFSDVILSARTGTEFSWDTANSQADLKARNLPISSKLPPSFVPIIDLWRRRHASTQEVAK